MLVGPPRSAKASGTQACPRWDEAILLAQERPSTRVKTIETAAKFWLMLGRLGTLLIVTPQKPPRWCWGVSVKAANGLCLLSLLLALGKDHCLQEAVPLLPGLHASS